MVSSSTFLMYVQSGRHRLVHMNIGASAEGASKKTMTDNVKIGTIAKILSKKPSILAGAPGVRPNLAIQRYATVHEK